MSKHDRPQGPRRPRHHLPGKRRRGKKEDLRGVLAALEDEKGQGGADLLEDMLNDGSDESLEVSDGAYSWLCEDDDVPGPSVGPSIEKLDMSLADLLDAKATDQGDQLDALFADGGEEDADAVSHLFEASSSESSSSSSDDGALVALGVYSTGCAGPDFVSVLSEVVWPPSLDVWTLP